MTGGDANSGADVILPKWHIPPPALAGLASGDRLLVGLYYAQRMKLAAIGRMRREHEATVSRHLTRVRREIRAGIERSLRDAHGFDEGAVAECFAAVAGDSGSLDLAAMLESADAGKNRPPDRSRDRRNHG